MSSRGFDKYQSTNPGELPEYGAIFMSNKATKKECFSRKLLGLPLAQADFVTQVKAGMILFLFEFEKKELHGVFRAVSDGAINIVPRAYSSSGKQFPAQVKFEQIWHCWPLKEHEFHDAIRENYFARFKFNFGLSDRQVRRLLVLFSSRKIKDDLLQMDSPLSKLPREIDYAINKPRNEDPDNFVKLQKDGRLGVITSRYSADYPGDFTYSPRGMTDNGRSPSAAIGITHRVDNEVGSHILDKQIGNFLGEIRRSIDDRAVISEAAGNEHNMNLEAEQPYATNPSSTDHLRFATGYGIRNAYEEGMSVPSYIPNLPSLYVPYVPDHKGACPSSDLLNSVFRPSMSSGEDLYADRANKLSSGPTCPEIEARKTLGSENPVDTTLARMSFYGNLSNQTANTGNKDISSSNNDHTALLDNNDLNPSIYENAHMYSDHKYRVSVFDRLAVPSETSKSSDAIGARSDECYSDSSVDEIMDALHQNHNQWMETGGYRPLNSFKKCGIKRRKTLNSKVFNDLEAKASKELDVAVNDVVDHEKSQLPAAEGIYFLDFKRRSKMQRTHDDAVNVDSDDLSLGQHKRRKLIRPNFHKHESHGDYIVGSSDNDSKPSENAGLPLLMCHCNLQVKNFDAGEIPDHGGDKVQNCEGKEATENCDKSLSKEDEDRKSPYVDTQNVFSPVSCKVEGTNIGHLSLESTQVSQNFESLRNSKVDDRKGTLEKTDVLNVFSSVSRRSEGKDGDERLSLGIIPELQNCGSIRDTKKVGKEESEKNDVPNCIGDPNPDNLSSLGSSEAGKLVQLRNYACYTILQELTSVLSRGERPESGLEIVGTHNHDVDDTKQLL